VAEAKGKNMKLGFLAAAALGLAASGQVFGREPEYTIPNGWANSRSGNNKSQAKAGKARAKAKVAAKSRRAQRKSGKR
jgi:hypothetical protein